MHEERNLLNITGELTKAELIEALKDIPDNARIYIEPHYNNNSGESITEVVDIKSISTLRYNLSDDIRTAVYFHTSNLGIIE